MQQHARGRIRAVGSRLELLSIHVPKTAGSSFRRILERVYHEEGELLSLYDTEVVAAIGEDRLPLIDAGVRAIHGHFPATRALRDAYPRARIVAWVREPVERAISYFHYWKRLPRHGNPLHDFFLDQDLSLVEFASHPAMVNEYSYYLGRIPLEDFFFVGLMERFDTDVALLAHRMGWPRPDVPRENVAGKKAPNIGDGERAKVEAALQPAVDLYRRIKARRGVA
jgi:hypothetical protein